MDARATWVRTNGECTWRWELNGTGLSGKKGYCQSHNKANKFSLSSLPYSKGWIWSILVSVATAFWWWDNVNGNRLERWKTPNLNFQPWLACLVVESGSGMGEQGNREHIFLSFLWCLINTPRLRGKIKIHEDKGGVIQAWLVSFTDVQGWPRGTPRPISSSDSCRGHQLPNGMP